METLQDLLNPANDNIPIVEDPRTGDVSMPGATLVHIKRSVMECEDIVSSQNGDASHLTKPSKPLVRKSKLVVVDLAGSERVHKSGSEGHMLEEAKSINLSLSSLGKCINALAENNAHVPFRDSKLTRMLRDSFGGTARTSLIVTIGPSPRHRGETSSTILFGQRAMKVENMLKIKEEFDYKSLSRKLEVQLDKLIAENERQQKAFEDEVEKINLEAQCRIAEVERNFADALEHQVALAIKWSFICLSRLSLADCMLKQMLDMKERLKCQMEYMELVKELEQKLVLNQESHDHNNFVADHGEGLALSSADEVAEVKMLLELKSSAERQLKKR
ncbi:P-loop containing nucleoside triphosphate hydrolase [Sesbania bispinosa]|nr:P-loop containing nucleoside triphosphate hydrolase [Sesbania bispinosa]